MRRSLVFLSLCLSTVLCQQYQQRYQPNQPYLQQGNTYNANNNPYNPLQPQVSRNGQPIPQQNIPQQQQQYNPALARNGQNYITGNGPPFIPPQNQQQPHVGNQYGQQPNMAIPGMAQQQQQQQRSTGMGSVLNKPLKLDAASNSSYGAQVNIQLTSYQDADLSLSKDTTCACPVQSCDFLPADQQNQCSFSFVIVISSPGQSVQYVQSAFNSFIGTINAGNWTTPYSFAMTAKPLAIDVFVQHLGVVIWKQTATLRYFNHLTLVDSFVVDMSTFTPGQNAQTFTLYGQQLRTQLSLSLSVNCINNMMGPNCDLQCNTTTNGNNNQQSIMCTDYNGNPYSCQYNGYNAQVTNCMACNNGVLNNTCAGTTVVTQNNGVSHAFRTWTIILGVLLGLLVLLLLCGAIGFIILRSSNRGDEEEHTPAYTSNSREYPSKPASRPLLDDEWTAAPRRTPAERDGSDEYRGASTMSRQEHQV